MGYGIYNDGYSFICGTWTVALRKFPWVKFNMLSDQVGPFCSPI